MRHAADGAHGPLVHDTHIEPPPAAGRSGHGAGQGTPRHRPADALPGRLGIAVRETGLDHGARRTRLRQLTDDAHAAAAGRRALHDLPVERRREPQLHGRRGRGTDHEAGEWHKSRCEAPPYRTGTRPSPGPTRMESRSHGGFSDGVDDDGDATCDDPTRLAV